ncbi:MAG: transglutaminase family protein [Actinomycetota bacterium]
MRLRIEHHTSYRYDHPVRNSKNEVRMTPVTTAYQTVEESTIVVSPSASHHTALRDYFGTMIQWFEVLEPHESLDVVASATVLTQKPPSPSPSNRTGNEDDPWAVEYLYPSPMVAWTSTVDAAAEALHRDDPMETILSVCSWLHSTLVYLPGSTIVGTPVAEVLAKGSGVCQDYAHAACAVLRSLQLPTRYVSGYFAPREIHPGEAVAAQSHAWIEAFVPGWGWWGIDPTNNDLAGERHIKVGHGRDYSDVVPFHGVHTGKTSQTLAVDVTIQNAANQ